MYTNIIWLFRRWRDRFLEIKREAEQKKELYQKKADSVKPKVFSGKGI